MLHRIKDTLSSIRSKTGDFTPVAGVVLGSGLGAFAESIDIEYSIPYSDIEGFPVSTVAGHSGRLIFGSVCGRKIVAMQGRFHYYEGYTPTEVVIPVRVMKMLGIRSLFLSNAAGGLNETFQVGDIMAITDHISFIPNPLIGPNPAEFGVRFPDMSRAYSPELLSRADAVAVEFGLEIKKGCYVAVTGPSYETPAEVRFYRMIGGDAVGMSTAPEVVAAVHAGIQVFAFSVITNLAPVPGRESRPASHEEVVREGAKAEAKMGILLTEMIRNQK